MLSSLSIWSNTRSLKRVHFLGHIDGQGVRPDPGKISAIRNVREPTCVSDVRRFLRMLNQMSKFSPNLAETTKPLRDMLNKKSQWIWDEPQRQAFEEIKNALCSSPILALFDLSRKTEVSADASSFGLGAVMRQKQPNQEWQPVVYISQAMTPTEHYAQIEKEVLALTWACERFANYLIGLTFQIRTDHKPLVPLFSSKHLNKLPLQTECELLWWRYLEGHRHFGFFIALGCSEMLASWVAPCNVYSFCSFSPI